MPHAEQQTEGRTGRGYGLPSSFDQTPSVSWWAALTALMCFVSAYAAIYWSRQPGSVAALWYANAIAVMLLSARASRDWPVLLVATVLGNVGASLAFGDPLPMSVAFVPANLAGVLLGAILMRRFCDAKASISDAGPLLRTMVLAGLVPALVGAVIGATTLELMGIARFQASWFTWFEGGLIGSAAVLPIGLLLLVRGTRAGLMDMLRPQALAGVLIALAVSLWAARAGSMAPVLISVALVLSAALGRFAGASLSVLLCSVLVGAVMAEGAMSLPLDLQGDENPFVYLALLLVLVPPLLLAVTLESLGLRVKELADREARFRNLYEKTPVMMHSVDVEGRLLAVNDEWLRALGYRRSDVIGRRSQEFLTEESQRLAVTSIVPEFMRRGSVFDVDYQMVASDGRIIDVLLSAIWETDASGQRTRSMTVIKDVTEQKRLAAALSAEQERIEVTLHSIGDGVVTTDDRGRIAYLNPVAERLVGWRLVDARARAFDEVVHLIDQSTNLPLRNPVERWKEADGMSTLPSHSVLRDRHGTETGVQDTVAPLIGRNGRLLGVVMVFRDVTESRALSQKLIYQAHHDALTDLPNRVLFQDRVDRACQFGHRHRGRFAVVFMDLDHFKHVNDSLGHAAGDDLLKIVAQRLLATLRGSDTVCRLGGDEFVMLLTDVSSSEAAGHVATKILRAVAVPSVLHGTEVNVGMSLGIAMFPDDGEDPETLMKHADAAMYRSKRGGRNRFEFFSRAVDQAASVRLRLEADMRRGLAEGQFVAHFQPIVDAATGQPVALEALARWMRPGAAAQNPAVFIPVAEESGLIVALGESMLRQACAQLSLWRGTALGAITMSVNVSPVQFAQANFIERVAQILADTGVSGTQLEFEITESTLMHDPEATLGLLRRIKAMGIRIAVDDFGTGYSSLSHLKRFPVDTVKVDRTFVRDLETDPDDRELIKAIVVMSRSLRLRVVAEGVETEAQAELLAAMDCTALQGFLYARPADAASVGHWLRAKLVPTVMTLDG